MSTGALCPCSLWPSSIFHMFRSTVQSKSRDGPIMFRYEHKISWVLSCHKHSAYFPQKGGDIGMVLAPTTYCRCFWSCCFIILVFIAFPETSLVKLSNQHYHSAYANIGKFVCCLQWPACHGAMLHCGTAASFPCQLIMPMDSHDCLSDSESCRVGVHAALAIWHLCLADPFGVLQCAGKDTAWLGLGVLTNLRSPIGWHQEATDWCII